MIAIFYGCADMLSWNGDSTPAMTAARMMSSLH